MLVTLIVSSLVFYLFFDFFNTPIPSLLTGGHG